MKKRFSICSVLLTMLMLAVLVIVFYPSPDIPTIQMDASWAEYYTDVEDLYEDSDLIAVVQVKDIAGTYMCDNIPMTNFTAEVETSIYGVQQSQEIIITQTGGTLDGQKFELSDDPLMSVGEKYLIFGKANDLGTVTLLGGPQGRFSYSNGQVTNLFDARIQTRSANAPLNFLSPEINFVNADLDTLIAQIDTYIGN